MATADAQSALFLLSGTGTPGFFGSQVAAGGDLDGDGVEDLLVADPWDDTNGQYSGAVRAFSGRGGSPLWAFVGNAGDGYGMVVGGVDVDGDGLGDVVIASSYQGNHRGVVNICSGVDGAILRSFVGEADDDWFGQSVAFTWDVDADGMADLLVGATGTDYGGHSTGSCYVYSSGTGALLYRFDGDALSQSFGHAVANAGDVNGDGVGDWIVGDPGWDHSIRGKAEVYSGADGSKLLTLQVPAYFSGFGWSLAALGDVNGDGRDDLVVGAPLDSTIATSAGSCWWFSGADGSILNAVSGAATNDALGYSLSGGGDWNADGWPDVVVGVLHGNVNGEVRIYSGPDASLLHSIRYSLDEDGVPGDAFGWSIDTVRDLDGDGLDELLIGALRGDTPNGVDTGSAWVYSLRDAVGDVYCGPAESNSSGGPGHVAATGSRVVFLNDVQLVASDLPLHEPGFFLVSLTPGFVSHPGGSQGNLCLSGAIGRYSRAGEVLDSGSSGQFQLSLDLSDTPQPTGPIAVLPGQTWHFQAWFRDHNPNATSNFTDGLTIPFY